MKRCLILLMTLALLGLLAACGAAAPNGSTNDTALPDGEDSGLSFAVVRDNCEEYLTASDGTALFRLYYELPRLELCTAEGEVYEPSASANNTPTLLPQEVRVRDTFNAEMERCADELKAEADEMAQGAEEYRALLTDGENVTDIWVSELTVNSVCQTSGGLVSVLVTGYSYYGGAHPNTYTRSWNFDLTTGEFLTVDDLAALEGDLSGESLTDRVYWALYDQVRAQELDKDYFDDYDFYLRDFSSFAVLNFTEDGLRATFDTYIIAPYAAGAQEFTVPYHAFYNALNDRARALLDIPQEEIVLADYRSAETLWAWFFMTTPPTGSMSDEAQIDGDIYYSADIPGVSTLQDMRALLYRYFDETLADGWLNESRRYRELDGRLYVLFAERGSDITIADEAFTVAISGSGGVLTQTVCYQDYDPETGMMVLTGETESFEYPFTLADGHAVFSAFPCPW